MKSQEIIDALLEKLEEMELSESNFYSGDISDADVAAIESVVGSFEQVEYGRGALGDHDSYDVVYHFKDHDVYLEANGSYSSWDGTDWSDASFYEVRPQQKTVTVYVSVK